jgi:hypothetical protein
MKITNLSIHPFRLEKPVKLLRLLTAGLMGTLLAACMGPAAAVATPTSAPIQATASPTVTIQWFPPTKTPRQFPTLALAATPEYHPGIGPLIFSDSFSEAGPWSTSTSDQVNALVTRNRLLLSFSGQGPFQVMSLRSEPILKDFYAEATADVSLCGASDQYGFIFRAQPGMNYYRFAVNCNGQVRLERSHNGQVYPIQEWVSSGDATFGAPARLTLGIWVVGNEMRAFLNDSFQFSVRDPLFTSGTIGFFVAAAGKTSVTASFSDLLVYSVDYIPPLPTATASPTLKP